MRCEPEHIGQASIVCSWVVLPALQHQLQCKVHMSLSIANLDLIMRRNSLCIAPQRPGQILTQNSHLVWLVRLCAWLALASHHETECRTQTVRLKTMKWTGPSHVHDALQGFLKPYDGSQGEVNEHVQSLQVRSWSSLPFSCQIDAAVVVCRLRLLLPPEAGRTRAGLSCA